MVCGEKHTHRRGNKFVSLCVYVTECVCAHSSNQQLFYSKSICSLWLIFAVCHLHRHQYHQRQQQQQCHNVSVQNKYNNNLRKYLMKFRGSCGICWNWLQVNRINFQFQWKLNILSRQIFMWWRRFSVSPVKRYYGSHRISRNVTISRF